MICAYQYCKCSLLNNKKRFTSISSLPKAQSFKLELIKEKKRYAMLFVISYKLGYNVDIVTAMVFILCLYSFTFSYYRSLELQKQT